MSSEIPRAPALGSVLTANTTMSAEPPLVMNVLDPLTTYSSPRRTAVVRIALRSDPAPGSLIPIAPMTSPVAIGGSHCFFCSSVP